MNFNNPRALNFAQHKLDFSHILNDDDDPIEFTQPSRKRRVSETEVREAIQYPQITEEDFLYIQPNPSLSCVSEPNTCASNQRENTKTSVKNLTLDFHSITMSKLQLKMTELSSMLAKETSIENKNELYLSFYKTWTKEIDLLFKTLTLLDEMSP